MSRLQQTLGCISVQLAHTPAWEQQLRAALESSFATPQRHATSHFTVRLPGVQPTAAQLPAPLQPLQPPPPALHHLPPRLPLLLRALLALHTSNRLPSLRHTPPFLTAALREMLRGTVTNTLLSLVPLLLLLLLTQPTLAITALPSSLLRPAPPCILAFSSVVNPLSLN
jgi:hypothetical protein